MTQQDARQLTDALVKRLDGQAEFEEVAPGRFRFAIISPRFVNMPHLRRQDQAWEVVESLLSREQVLDLSLLLTFAPDEVQLTSNV